MDELHEIRGRLAVALDLVSRAALGMDSAGFDPVVLDALGQANETLRAVAASVDDRLNGRRLGPAA